MSEQNSTMPVGRRVALTGAVLIVTALSYELVWGIGIALLRLEAIFGTPVRQPALLMVAYVSQWVVAALSIFLILCLLARPKYIRAVTYAWFTVQAIHYLIGLFLFGNELTWFSIVLPIGLVVGATVAILWITSVRPDKRLKLPARVH